MKALCLLSGAVFGFLLSRARVTDYDTMIRLFLFEDFHVLGVMGAAIGVAAVGLALVRRGAARSIIGCPIEIGRKPMTPAIWLGAPLFGIGWGLTGT